MRAIPQIEATDADVLRDTIRHHDALIWEVMEAAADRYRQRGPEAQLDAAQLDELIYRFLLVLTVECELGSRPPST